MARSFLEIAITPSVRAVQSAMGSDRVWTGARTRRASDVLTADEVGFIAARDTFYMATVSESGWPYVQHRGGPRGFLKVVDERTLAFADYQGNRQYISAGNAKANGKACLLLMDYAQPARLKMYVQVEIVAADAEPVLAALVASPGYRAKTERIFRLRLEAFDWNCPQHITRRFTAEEFMAAYSEQIEN
jgi:predicted pyridoxine 5'-phosphate oxidase superfamily flavin-nucleotide-binding protein